MPNGNIVTSNEEIIPVDNGQLKEIYQKLMRLKNEMNKISIEINEQKNVVQKKKETQLKNTSEEGEKNEVVAKTGRKEEEKDSENKKKLEENVKMLNMLTPIVTKKQVKEKIRKLYISNEEIIMRPELLWNETVFNEEIKILKAAYSTASINTVWRKHELTIN